MEGDADSAELWRLTLEHSPIGMAWSACARRSPPYSGYLELLCQHACRLRGLLSDLLQVGQARLFAEEYGVLVRVNVPDHLTALGDRQRIRQVQDNLLSAVTLESELGRGSTFRVTLPHPTV